MGRFFQHCSPWVENEIDYVLFVTVPSKDSITIRPHPDEVDDVCWVTQDTLLAMFANKDLLFSPWFRLIANRWMMGKGGWWDDLDRTMTTMISAIMKISIVLILQKNTWGTLALYLARIED